jgi:shikimate kinase
MTALQNIVLIGFMGCGKTTVGQLVAEKLNWPFVDTDALVVEAAGLSIADIFTAVGESGFREIESGVLTSLGSGESRVIATGGGIVTQKRNEALLRSLGFVVWLSASEQTIFERVSRHPHRPLLQTVDPRRTIHELLEKRRPLYASFAHLTIETAGLEPEEIAYGICESARHFFRPR